MRLLLSLLLFTSSLTTASAEFKTDEEVSNWVTYYYTNPKPTKIPDAIQYMSQAGWFDNKKSIAPLFGFLAGVFNNNPDKVTDWVNKLSDLEEPHLSVVILGLWYADLPDSQKRVYELLDKNPKSKEHFSYLYKGSPMAIEQIPLEQGSWVLDALWGNFMATGNKQPVVKIMSALPWLDVKGDINRLLIGGTARWSLTSNAVQHQKVMTFCKEEVNNQPPDIAEKLREIIQNAQAELENKPNTAPQSDAP